MWFVYILYSATSDRYYVGYTADVRERVCQHNDGWGRYTRRGIPWGVVYTEQFATKRAAIQRE